MSQEIPAILQKNYPVLASALALTLAAVRYYPLVKRVGQALMRPYRILEQVATLPDKVDKLSAQVHPNGGGSLRDAVDAIRCDQLQIKKSVQDLGERHMTRWKLAFGTPSWEANAMGQWIAVNSEFTDMVGVSESQVLGSNWKGLIHPEDRHEVLVEWNRVVAEGSDLRTPCRLICQETGKVYPVNLFATYMPSIGWIGKVTTRSEK